MYIVNDHEVNYVYQGMDSWVIDGKAVFFCLGDAAFFCGVSVEYFKKAVEY